MIARVLSAAASFAWRVPRWVLIGLVRAYQVALSPFFPSTCRFRPTCSAYAVEALRRYGVLKGLVLTAYRLGRCHPWGGHGYDPPRWFGEPPPEQAEPPPEQAAAFSSCTSPTCAKASDAPA